MNSLRVRLLFVVCIFVCLLSCFEATSPLLKHKFNLMGNKAQCTYPGPGCGNGNCNCPNQQSCTNGDAKSKCSWDAVTQCCKVGSTPPPPPPTGSCQPSSSLSVLVTGTNVVAYIPKGSWGGGATGVSVVNVEGSSVTPTLVSTPNVVNSCACNSLSGVTVCTANNPDVYLLTGTTLTNTLTSGASGSIGFSGGVCTNCGVAMDATHNRALLGLSVASVGGYQFLDLTTNTFGTPTASPAGIISEDLLIDPIRNLALSPSENNNFEIVNVASPASPGFFEFNVGPIGTFGELDSAGEDCTTGIALAPAEFTTNVYLVDLTQVTYTPGSPGSWSSPGTNLQTLSEADSLSAGASGVAVAQGTHIGIVSGEFHGDAITAIQLPATSGSGTPAITDWVTCNIGGGFDNGFDPHTLTAYKSPSTGHAIAILANGGATMLAVVDLTLMLDTTQVPRTVGGHGCATAPLPASVVSFISVP